MESPEQEHFIKEYVELCIKYNCYVEGCGCNQFLNDLQKEIDWFKQETGFEYNKETFLKKGLQYHEGTR